MHQKLEASCQKWGIFRFLGQFSKSKIISILMKKKISMKNTKLKEQLLIKLLLNQAIFKKLFLVKMCPIFDSSPPVFGARYQSFLRVGWFLHKGVPYFGYPSEQLNNPIDITTGLFKPSSKSFRWSHPRSLSSAELGLRSMC